MKVSIITVCFNSAKTVKDTLLSVATQKNVDVEHIVVDGGSTDGTLEIIHHNAGYLSHVLSEPDQGIYDAMNKGLKFASGDIICFLNADDVYASDHVLSRVSQKIQSETLDVVYGDVAFYRSDNPLRVIRRYQSSRFSPSKIKWGWMPAHPALFISRDAFFRVGRFKADYKIAGDFEFIARLFGQRGLRYSHLPEILVNMRMGGVSTSGWRSTLRLNREVLRACRENGIYSNALMLLAKYPFKVLEFIWP